MLMLLSSGQRRLMALALKVKAYSRSAVVALSSLLVRPTASAPGGARKLRVRSPVRLRLLLASAL